MSQNRLMTNVRWSFELMSFAIDCCKPVVILSAIVLELFTLNLCLFWSTADTDQSIILLVPNKQQIPIVFLIFFWRGEFFFSSRMKSCALLIQRFSSLFILFLLFALSTSTSFLSIYVNKIVWERQRNLSFSSFTITTPARLWCLKKKEERNNFFIWLLNKRHQTHLTSVYFSFVNLFATSIES